MNPDFDLCEKCEDKINHPYPLLKIRNPNQVPRKLICSYKTSEESGFRAQRKPKQDVVVFNARFIKESFGDKHEILPNQGFIKSWTFRNDGETAWPEDSVFVYTNGDDLQSVPFVLEKQIQKGDTVTVYVQMTSPKLPGSYQTFFRFAHGDN